MTLAKISSTISFLLLFVFVSGQTNTKTVAEHYKTKQFNCAIFPSDYINLPPIGSSDRFTPTHADIDKAESALKNKLKSLTNDSPKIYKNLKHYRRQYIGFKNKDGQKIVIINCMWSNDENTNNNWLNEYIMTLDGGSDYWNINYNIVTDTLFNISINGES